MIDLAPVAGIAVLADPRTGELALAGELVAEEVAVRPLAAAEDAYADPPSVEPAPLYHMLNGITPRDAREPESGLLYELTSLRPGTVGPEWVKTIGHLHDRAPDGLGYPEAYEVVEGRGRFVLFRPADPTTELRAAAPSAVTCAVVEADAGEAFVIPPGWHHLAVNPGDTTMVFADIVGRAVRPDYSVLRTLRGGPVHLGPGGVRANPRYPAVAAVRIRAVDLPRPTDDLRLAAAFFGDRSRMDFLLEPARYAATWSSFDAAVASAEPLPLDDHRCT